MNTKTLIIVSAILLIAFGCKNKTAKNTPEEMLTAFYTQYIAEQSKPQPDVTVISALYDKYLTAELRQKLEGALEHDPFLNAQDCDENWAKTLKILPVEGQENVYQVCYSYNDEHTNCITLYVVKINDNYLINDISNLSEAFVDYWDNYREDTEETDGIDILLPATYRGTEPADFQQMLSEEWYDFYQDNSTKNYCLKKAVLEIGKLYVDCLGDSSTYISSQRESIILVKGIKPQNAEIKSIPVEKNSVWVDEKYTFSFNGKNHTFRGDGVVEKGETDSEQWNNVKNYTLYLSEQGKDEQLLIVIPDFHGTTAQILWIGDLDEDGKPDFILDTSRDYEEKAVVLFLSSKAKDGEIVKRVAGSSYQFDC